MELQCDMWIFDPRNWRVEGPTDAAIRERYLQRWKTPTTKRFPAVTAKRSLLRLFPLLKNSYAVAAQTIVDVLRDCRESRLSELALFWENETCSWIQGEQQGAYLIEDAKAAYRQWQRVLALLGLEAPPFDWMYRLGLAGEKLARFKGAFDGTVPLVRPGMKTYSHGGENTHGKNKEQTHPDDPVSADSSEYLERAPQDSGRQGI